jgi:hypothetical protein
MKIIKDRTKSETKASTENKTSHAVVMRRCDVSDCGHNVKFFGGKGFCLEGEEFEVKPDGCPLSDGEWERKFAKPYGDLPKIS